MSHLGLGWSIFVRGPVVQGPTVQMKIQGCTYFWHFMSMRAGACTVEYVSFVCLNTVHCRGNWNRKVFNLSYDSDHICDVYKILSWKENYTGVPDIGVGIIQSNEGIVSIFLLLFLTASFICTHPLFFIVIFTFIMISSLITRDFTQVCKLPLLLTL